MVKKNVTAVDKMGFHMRPANVFVTEMANFKSDINLIAGEKTINGKAL